MTTGERLEPGPAPDAGAGTAAAEGAAPPRLQPPLHELVAAVAAPTCVFSAVDGDIDVRRPDAGAHGFYHDDVRMLAVARLTLGGTAPTAVLGAPDGPARARFVGLARALGNADAADASVRVDRRRRVAPGLLEEEVTVSSTATREVRADLTLELEADFAPMARVKGGGRVPRPGGASVLTAAGAWTAQDAVDGASAPASVVVRSEGAVAGPHGLTWPLTVAPRTSVTVRWTATASGPQGPFGAAGDAAAAVAVRRPRLRAGDARLTRLVDQGLDDARSLLLASRTHPADTFVGAGAPWFLTLFGRDSLWAARMLLPLGTELAAGTLRLLAALQGRRHDAESQEEPGKILHEVRVDAFEHMEGSRLPPVYYGTVDATLLWICLLHDAWRWGLPDQQVEQLLPALEAALAWSGAAADAGDGFLAYHDRSGRGLANQGWKDSGDAIRFADGRLARPPVALAEVQGYAHEAALGGAALLDAFGRPGGDRWRAWAAELAARFRRRYWVETEHGRYPAMALDRDGRPVDSVASNMGHLIGTGLLDEAETDAVAARLTAPDMAAGYGLRTMSALMAGYSPTSYHCGSVWPHDTAIAISGLARSGRGPLAAELVTGLLAATPGFGGRLPELWGGDARSDVPAAVAYPGACRPQAWAATTGVAVAAALLGLAPDVPGGRLDVRPVAPSPVAGLRAHGLRLAGHPLDVEVDAEGRVTHVATTAPVRIERG